MILGTVSDLADRLGQTLTPGTPDYKRAYSNLFDASALVTRETRAWKPGDDIPDVVKTVALAAAERKFRNPSGLANRTMGPFGEGYGASSASGVYLTEDELRILGGYSDSAGGILSVPIVRATDTPDRRGSDWAFIPGSSEPFPYFPPGWEPEA